MKLVGKTVVDHKTHRIHDRAKTPYQRVLWTLTKSIRQ